MAVAPAGGSGGMVPVFPGLYVGGAESCSSPEALAAAGVVAVLTVDAEEPPAVPGVRAMHVRARDEPGADLLSRLDECAAFLGAARAGGGAALVRWVNPGFQAQLKLYEAMGCAVDRSSALYRRYRLRSLAERDPELQDLPREVFAVDPTILCQTPNTEVLYRCRKCRRALFRSSSILSHTEGSGPAAFAHKRVTDSAQLCVFGRDKCTSYFIEPVQWMEPALLGVMEGQLLCPKCTSKLGSFSWQGEQCSCGRWVTPAFQIHKSRVDEVKSLASR
ncbi:dual specificity protein phosphatase 12 isoform X2 [Falco rusticolus]|uniref:dual specificity protein phosphatase 12 isoform X2 n=1 Tax=Falco rusticolus TaxID=120794 RepID=UPI0018866299|nr:dual specificity protein phosphatase 12 isoform X2 [Falco rusticolus]XP_055567229.1 dual specificity protein phosphatase 12 isoform X3 [Falco cherrug]